MIQHPFESSTTSSDGTLVGSGSSSRTVVGLISGDETNGEEQSKGREGLFKNGGRLIRKLIKIKPSSKKKWSNEESE